ncbi:hypothetical protein [uncultured Thiodictyon sp.]|uniref:hypothetical protein n=1 Tax=uncultured Thiodictyon sp. TaxID=1846217 RepID=UPI0025F54EEE|nr:hypothetical protein [uncultured Thiodictyon sp.]
MPSETHYDLLDNSSDYPYFVRPFELTLDAAASLLHDGLALDEQNKKKATRPKIHKALTDAVIAGDLHLKRGILKKYDWPGPEPILDAREVQPWARGIGLALLHNGPWGNYMLKEGDLVPQDESARTMSS